MLSSPDPRLPDCLPILHAALLSQTLFHHEKVTSNYYENAWNITDSIRTIRLHGKKLRRVFWRRNEWARRVPFGSRR